MAVIGGLPSPPPKWSAEIFEISTLVDDKIEVLHDIWENSEFVFLNGISMSVGAAYDYTIIGKREIKFNLNVLTDDGHLLVKYTYQ